MPKWFMIAMCALVALLVLWILVHPNIELAPTALRFTAFAAAVMLVLRSCFRFTKPLLFSSDVRVFIAKAFEVPRSLPVSCSSPLRC